MNACVALFRVCSCWLFHWSTGVWTHQQYSCQTITLQETSGLPVSEMCMFPVVTFEMGFPPRVDKRLGVPYVTVILPAILLFGLIMGIVEAKRPWTAEVPVKLFKWTDVTLTNHLRYLLSFNRHLLEIYLFAQAGHRLVRALWLDLFSYLLPCSLVIPWETAVHTAHYWLRHWMQPSYWEPTHLVTLVDSCLVYLTGGR